MRILHFSDTHFELLLKTIPLKEWFGKRGIGALNLLRGRGKHFDGAKKKMKALLEFKEKNSIDLTVCTGDFTALGLENEIVNALEIITPFAKSENRFIAVPGNHDVYLYDSLSLFKRYFGEFMKSDLPQYTVDGIFPFVRVFDEVVVIGLNSAKPNPIPWNSNGYISDKQLNALEKIFKDGRLKDKFMLIATHYAPRDSNGEPDKPRHGLINASEFLNICKGVKKGAIVTGHIHKAFTTSLCRDGLDISLFCAGSVTMNEKESFWIFDISKDSFQARKGVYKNNQYTLL